MTFGATPFDSPVSISRAPDEFEDEIDPALRSPAFRNPSDDLEQTNLEMSDEEIIQTLGTYFDEAEAARETGLNPRHQVWEENLHAFWMRKDFADKMDWQSKEISAAVPNYVERFSATHRQALTQSADWAKVKDLKDPHGFTSAFATKLTRLGLDFSGTNASGQPVAFEYAFGNVCQTGALMAMAMAVTWDERNKRVITEQVDPRQLYLDPTGRGLFRVRFWEADKETLLRMADLTDSEGEPIYRGEAIEGLVAYQDDQIRENDEISSGQGSTGQKKRTPILIKEWLVDLIDGSSGEKSSKKVRERQLVVTANDHTIIRGPEPNPYWHGKDWIVYHPVLQAPLSSPDGRTYVEMFIHSVGTHENVMNRIIDNLSMNMNAFEVNPDVLDNPEVIEFGVSPNMTMLRAEDAPPNEKAITSVDIGKGITPDMMNVWQATRQEMQEAAAQSDLSLGQTVSVGSATATEVAEASRGQSALNNSISMDIDMGFLTPIAELVFYTALQRADETSPGIWDGLDEKEQSMLANRREEFRGRAIVVKAQGLTQAVERSKRLRGLLGTLNVVGGNPVLAEAFQRKYSLDRLVSLILEDYGVPAERIELTEDEKIKATDEATKRKLAAVQGGQAPTANNQNGLDPLANGVPEGLGGDQG